MQDTVASVRRAFFWAFLRGLRILWPVLSGLFVVISGLGAAVGVAEGWGIAQGVYFSFVTGLTIGYGDLAPSRFLTKVLAMVIGLLGLAVTGLVAALAVTAFEATPLARGRRSSSQVNGGVAGPPSPEDGPTG
jgi:Ion channel